MCIRSFKGMVLFYWINVYYNWLARPKLLLIIASFGLFFFLLEYLLAEIDDDEVLKRDSKVLS